jgi:hypothetical protein
MLEKPLPAEHSNEKPSGAERTGEKSEEVDRQTSGKRAFGLRKIIGVSAIGMVLLVPGTGGLVLLNAEPEKPVIATAVIPEAISLPEPQKQPAEAVSGRPNATPTTANPGDIITSKPAAEPRPGKAEPAQPEADAKPPPSSEIKEPAAGSGAQQSATLVARGDAQFAMGDVGAARLLYERAAGAGNADAALRMGQTFDPAFLAQTRLRGIHGDPLTAASWYMRADKLGAPEASGLLQGLAADIGISQQKIRAPVPAKK